MKMEEIITIEGRRQCMVRSTIYYVLSTLTLGIIPFILKYYPRVRIYCKTKSCLLRSAHIVVAVNQYKRVEIKRIEEIKINIDNNYIDMLDRHINNGKVRIVTVFYRRLVFDYIDNIFNYPEIKKNYRITEILAMTENDRDNIRYENNILYGKNTTEVACSSILDILLDNIISIFTVYTAIAIIVWLNINYHIYAFFIFLTTVYILYGEISGDLAVRKSRKELGGKNGSIYVFRGKWCYVSSEDVYPGELVLIEENTVFTCDVKICDGEVAVDESFLTGESTPIFKIMGKEESGGMVFSGTKIILSKGYGAISLDGYKSVDDKIPAVGVVISTGFRTSRGEMIRNILVSEVSEVQFYRDCLKFVFFLIVVGLILSVIIFCYFISRSVPPGKSLTFSIDLFTALVAPVLPVSMKLGLSVSLNRLRENGIICNEPERINLTGKCDIVIFDKTGTLTENELDLKYLDTIEYIIPKNKNIEDENINIGLSTCHSLIKLGEKLLGDPMEIKMVECTKADIINTQTIKYNDKILKIINIHEFNSKLMRMSVVIEEKNKKYIFSKGSAESIGTILEEIPTDYYKTVEKYTKKGYRVLTMAYKENVENEIREENEKNLKFLTFLIFVNKLKSNTESIISELREANIKTIISTGDNMLTAISVAKECGIIGNKEKPICKVKKIMNYKNNHPYCDILGENIKYNIFKVRMKNNKIDFQPIDKDEECTETFYCIDGIEYENIREEKEIKEILDKSIIFSRMNPTQKTMLAEDMKRYLSYTTVFCGDGANDCGAIRAADVGITISENEATVTSPFVSSTPNISAVKTIISDGRAAMITGLSNFKFIIITSLSQYFTLGVLTLCFSFLSDIQTLHYDMMLVFPATIIMSSLLPSDKLSNNPLPHGLFFYIIEIISIIIINSIFIIILVYNSISNIEYNGVFITKSIISSMLFFLVSAQCIINSIFLTDGRPHRENKWGVRGFVWYVFIGCLSLIFLFIVNLKEVRESNFIFKCIVDIYEFVEIPKDKIYLLMGCMIVNYILLVVNDYIIKDIVEKWLYGRYKRERDRKVRDEYINDRDNDGDILSVVVRQ